MAGELAAAKAGGTAEESGSATVLQVLGAIATGIGVLGFVAAVGGMIIYARADAAGLPADHALAVVPRGSLIATGAVTLVPAAALAFLFVLVLYFVGWLLERLETSSIERRYAPAESLEEDAAYSEDWARELRQSERDASAQAAANQRAIDALMESPNPDDAAITSLREKMELAQAEATAAAANARTASARAEESTKEAAAMRDRRTEESNAIRGTRIGAFFALVLLLLAALIVVGVDGFGAGQLAVLAVVALVTALVSLTIYANKGRRFMFIVSSFVAIGLFVGLASYYRTHNTPKLEPAAALRADGTIVFGYFVAESDKDVYIARPESTGAPSRIVQLPRSEVTDVSVGKLTAPANFPLLHARGIARRLCAEGARGTVAATGKAKSTVATVPKPAPAPVLDASELRCTSPAVKAIANRRAKTN